MSKLVLTASFHQGGIYEPSLSVTFFFSFPFTLHAIVYSIGFAFHIICIYGIWLVFCAGFSYSEI